MESNTNLFMFIFLLHLSLLLPIKSQDPAPIMGVDYPDIQCGKNNPKKITDCTKYGTDSKMLCCSVKGKNTDKIKGCYLMHESMAESKGINPSHDFDNESWDCGNNSHYLKVYLAFIFIFYLL